MTRSLLLAAVIALAATYGASSQAAPPEPEELTRTSLIKYEARWLAKRVRAYSFTLERSCFCAPRVASAQYTVNKRQSRLVAATNAETAVALQPYSSIEKLFTAMRQTLQKGGRVAAVFDGGGYPKQVTLDPLPQAADDELYLTITKLNPKR